MVTRFPVVERALHPHIATPEFSTAGWRPVFFRLSCEDERTAFVRLLDDQVGLQVHDTLETQLRDLMKVRHPSRRLSEADLNNLVSNHLSGVAPLIYGAWVYYPWSRHLVHLLDAEEFAELRTNRNCQKITPEEQQVLHSKKVGVVGLSVGQSVAVTLALERSIGELRLADFDVLDVSNLNRIRAGVHNVGVPKVEVTAREIAEIDPYLTVRVFHDGITAGNAEGFLMDGGRLDAVAEECDSFDIKVLVRDCARRHGIPVVMDTSDRGMLDIERFDLEPQRPLFHGLAGDLNPNDLTNLTTEEKLPYVLRIVGTSTMSTRLRASLVEVNQTISTWPQLGSEVAHGGAAAARCIRRLLLGEPMPSGRFFFDLDDLAAHSSERLSPTTPSAKPPPRLCAAVVAEPVSAVAIRDLVSLAICAPSGGNSQPWKWLSDGDDLHLFLDRERSSGLIDFESGGSYVALGCATETLVLAAHAKDMEIGLRAFPSEGSAEWAASVHLRPSGQDDKEPHWRDELHSQIELRHTNRSAGDGAPLTHIDLVALTTAVRSVPLADVQWICERERLDALGALMGTADRIRMFEPEYHKEMFGELRWSDVDAASTRDGIEVTGLDLTQSDRAGLELCRDWPSIDLVRQWKGGRNLERSARKGIASASAVGLVTMPGSRPVDYFQGGRAIQRMWLAATERGLAVHPMATLPYLFARVLRGKGQGLSGAAADEISSLRPSYKTLFRVADEGAEVLLFLVGHARHQRKRSLRRPVDAVLSRA